MEKKEFVKKALEFLLVTTPLWAPIATVIISRIHYNSLSREEKIEHLEKQSNTVYKNSFPPVGRGAALYAYNISKERIKRELEKLRSSGK
jgi:CO dehydrogenase/acetyl-CoA synthase beta subunit